MNNSMTIIIQDVKGIKIKVENDVITISSNEPQSYGGGSGSSGNICNCVCNSKLSHTNGGRGGY